METNHKTIKFGDIVKHNIYGTYSIVTKSVKDADDFARAFQTMKGTFKAIKSPEGFEFLEEDAANSGFFTKISPKELPEQLKESYVRYRLNQL